jgi:DNA-directed RNA polymerase subunit RPC12/RpoP
MTLEDGKKIKIELNDEEIARRLDQIEKLPCDDELRNFLISILEAVIRLDEIIGMKKTTIARLRKIFGKKSERTVAKKKKDGSKKPHGRSKGQGNNSSNEYKNAKQISHFLDESLKPGMKCPECGRGTLHKYTPGIFVRITGGPSLTAVVHETEKVRCSACGKIFEADFVGKNGPKYDEKAISIIAILHYLASIPFYRLGKIQKVLKTPMPRSVQWSLMEELANDLLPVWKSIIKYAKEADLFYSDDTGGKILSVMQNNKKKKEYQKLYFKNVLIKMNRLCCFLTEEVTVR